MNRLIRTCTGMCVVFAIACSSGGTVSPDGAPAGTGDSAASGGMRGTGGDSATGGGTGTGAGPVASGGASATGGRSATGGASATGGTRPTGGEGATGGGSAIGGAKGTGGVSGTGGTAGTTGHGGVAPMKIDFSIWSLQLPTGSGTSPTTISASKLAAGYTSDYFYLAPDGGQIFMDPATGITTPGSAHCRTELHEQARGGGSAAWSSKGTNTMTVSGTVLQVGGGAAGRVTVGQLFNGTDEVPLCELEYSATHGGFDLLYEEAKGSGTTINLNTAFDLKSPYTFSLALTQGVLIVTIGGQEVFRKTPSASVLAKTFYFKVGNYDQTATAGAISTVPYTLVEVYSVDVLHL